MGSLLLVELDEEIRLIIYQYERRICENFPRLKNTLKNLGFVTHEDKTKALQLQRKVRLKEKNVVKERSCIYAL